MARKIIQRYIQGTLFGDDEVQCIKSSPMRYDDYNQGARDMLLRCLDHIPDAQRKIRHLPRRYMAALITCLINDKNAMQKFAQGGKMIFVTKQDNGNIIEIKAHIK